MVEQRTTWDGLPIAAEPPYGASVIVYRRSPAQLLLLHRAHYGPAFDGDWAWTPPAGSRQPGEDIDDCARRELAEEAGLSVATLAALPDANEPNWHYYAHELAADAEVRLVDVEHDRFEWLPVADAVARIRPDFVAAAVRRACTLLQLIP